MSHELLCLFPYKSFLTQIAKPCPSFLLYEPTGFFLIGKCLWRVVLSDLGRYHDSEWTRTGPSTWSNPTHPASTFASLLPSPPPSNKTTPDDFWYNSKLESGLLRIGLIEMKPSPGPSSQNIISACPAVGIHHGHINRPMYRFWLWVFYLLYYLLIQMQIQIIRTLTKILRKSSILIPNNIVK